VRFGSVRPGAWFVLVASWVVLRADNVQAVLLCCVIVLMMGLRVRSCQNEIFDSLCYECFYSESLLRSSLIRPYPLRL